MKHLITMIYRCYCGLAGFILHFARFAGFIPGSFFKQVMAEGMYFVCSVAIIQ